MSNILSDCQIAGGTRVSECDIVRLLCQITKLIVRLPHHLLTRNHILNWRTAMLTQTFWLAMYCYTFYVCLYL